MDSHLTKPSTPDSTSNIRYERANWPLFYDSVEELARAPRVDAIVRGVIIAVESFEDPVEDGSVASLIATLALLGQNYIGYEEKFDTYQMRLHQGSI